MPPKSKRGRRDGDESSSQRRSISSGTRAQAATSRSDRCSSSRDIEKSSNTCDKLLEYKYYQQNRALTADDYKSLGDGNYLNEGIIDFYLAYLISETYLDRPITKKIFVCDCYVNLILQRKRFESLNRMMNKLKVDIFTMEYIVVPINYVDGEEKHWYLAIISNPKQAICKQKEKKELPQILYLNSWTNMEQNDEFAKLLRTFLEREAMRSHNMQIQLNENTMPVREVKVPQQKNDYDCGCYVLMFVETLLENNEIPEKIPTTRHIQKAAAMREKLSKATIELMKKQSDNPDQVKAKLPKIKLPQKV